MGEHITQALIDRLKMSGVNTSKLYDEFVMTLGDQSRSYDEWRECIDDIHRFNWE